MPSIKKTLEFSTKQSLVDKDNNFILVLLTITSAITIFCIVSASSLYAKLNYQQKVIRLRNSANTQLSSNYNTAQNLANSYQKFEAAAVPIKNVTSNTTMVLDALPSKYDFPALFTSLSTRMAFDNMVEKSLTATDDQKSALQSSPDPKLVPMPFTISGEGSPSAAYSYIKDLENSIRPMVVSNVIFDAGQPTSSSSSKVTLTVKATTYYQPEKTFQIVNKTVSANGDLR